MVNLPSPIFTSSIYLPGFSKYECNRGSSSFWLNKTRQFWIPWGFNYPCLKWTITIHFSESISLFTVCIWMFSLYRHPGTSGVLHAQGPQKRTTDLWNWRYRWSWATESIPRVNLSLLASPASPSNHWTCSPAHSPLPHHTFKQYYAMRRLIPTGWVTVSPGSFLLPIHPVHEFYKIKGIACLQPRFLVSCYSLVLPWHILNF